MYKEELVKYKVQTALEEIEADFPGEAFEKFLNMVREITVIVEEGGLGKNDAFGKTFEFTITSMGGWEEA